MRRGVWHQFGDKSQKIAGEHLDSNDGVGAIISSRDLSFDKADEYSEQYRISGADVIFDHQFYVPPFTNRNLVSYPTEEFRESISHLGGISDDQLAKLSTAMERVHVRLQPNAMLAPAVIYEAGRRDVSDLNRKLFEAAKKVGDQIGTPTYATVVLGRSVTASPNTILDLLADATALPADGWYFGFEFQKDSRVPNVFDEVRMFCGAALILALTGRPVLHAFAGPMALLSFGCGCTGTAISHNQNVWSFKRERFQAPESEGGGGGGAGASRFFSTALWGTIVQPDEVVLLSPDLRSRVLTHSPFSKGINSKGTGLLTKAEEKRHLIHSMCKTVTEISNSKDPERCAIDATAILENAISLLAAMPGEGRFLKDATSSYQGVWRAALVALLKDRAADFQFFKLLSGADEGQQVF